MTKNLLIVKLKSNKNVQFGKIENYTVETKEGKVIARSSFKIYGKKKNNEKFSFSLSARNLDLKNLTFATYTDDERKINVYNHETKEITEVNRDTILKSLFDFDIKVIKEDDTKQTKQITEDDLPFF